MAVTKYLDRCLFLSWFILTFIILLTANQPWARLEWYQFEADPEKDPRRPVTNTTVLLATYDLCLFSTTNCQPGTKSSEVTCRTANLVPCASTVGLWCLSVGLLAYALVDLVCTYACRQTVTKCRNICCRKVRIFLGLLVIRRVCRKCCSRGCNHRYGSVIMCISTRLGCFATLMWLAALLLFFALMAWQWQCIDPFVADKASLAWTTHSYNLTWTMVILLSASIIMPILCSAYLVHAWLHRVSPRLHTNYKPAPSEGKRTSGALYNEQAAAAADDYDPNEDNLDWDDEDEHGKMIASKGVPTYQQVVNPDP